MLIHIYLNLASRAALLSIHCTLYITSVCGCMGRSRKIFRGGEPSIVGIKVAQFNVLLELQLITSLVISQIPVESANTRVGKSHIWGVPPPLTPLKSAYVWVHVYPCRGRTIVVFTVLT